MVLLMNQKNKKNGKSFVQAIIVNLILFSSALAQNPYYTPPAKDAALKALKDKIEPIFKLVFGLSGAIFVVVILVGGLQYLTSAGNEEAVARGKKTLTYGIIGITITIMSYAIAGYILTKLNTPMPDIITPS